MRFIDEISKFMELPIVDRIVVLVWIFLPLLVIVDVIWGGREYNYYLLISFSEVMLFTIGYGVGKQVKRGKKDGSN